MSKAIQYPTQEWIDKWIDKYLDDHPDEKIDNFDELKEIAECDWWDNETDHGRPTPFDLTPEQKKAQKEAMKGMAKAENAVNAYGKAVKRERKPNERKRWVIERVKVLLEGFALNREIESVAVANVERAIDFWADGKHYTLTLTEHRAPKEKKS